MCGLLRIFSNYVDVLRLKHAKRKQKYTLNKHFKSLIFAPEDCSMCKTARACTDQPDFKTGGSANLGAFKLARHVQTSFFSGCKHRFIVW